VPSVSAHPTRLAVAAISGLLLIGGAAGCSTTQEKAERHQAESERILDQREKRQQRKKQDKADEKKGGENQ